MLVDIKNDERSVIVYSPSCSSKPVQGTQKNGGNQTIYIEWGKKEISTLYVAQKK